MTLSAMTSLVSLPALNLLPHGHRKGAAVNGASAATENLSGAYQNLASGAAAGAGAPAAGPGHLLVNSPANSKGSGGAWSSPLGNGVNLTA